MPRKAEQKAQNPVDHNPPDLRGSGFTGQVSYIQSLIIICALVRVRFAHDARAE